MNHQDFEQFKKFLLFQQFLEFTEAQDVRAHTNGTSAEILDDVTFEENIQMMDAPPVGFADIPLGEGDFKASLTEGGGAKRRREFSPPDSISPHTQNNITSVIKSIAAPQDSEDFMDELSRRLEENARLYPQEG